MKISKARLVEIIKEEIENLEEGPFGGLFGRGKDIETGFRRDRPTGSREGYVEPFRGPVADAAKARRDAEVASDEQASKIKKDIFAQIMKWANDNKVATERDAGRMDQEASKEDFARVMAWANKEGVATEEDIEKQIEQELDQRLKYYTPKAQTGALKKQMQKRFEEPYKLDEDEFTVLFTSFLDALEDSEEFDELVASKINQRQHKAGEE